MSAGVQLRRVPYPYRAMAAIANDVDEATWNEFVLLHQFLNTAEPTPLGPGLEMEIGDSFFFYSTVSPEKKSTFSYFAGADPDRRAPWSTQVESLISAGYLDCLHSWGDFSRTGGFNRSHAVRAAEVLRKSPRTVRVWINHGDALNEQMVGRAGWDDPAAPNGHADLTFGCGIEYFWTGGLTATVGQDAEEGIPDRLAPARIVEEFVRPLRRVAAGHTGLVKFFGNHLIRPATVRGHAVKVFQRYGFWDKPTVADISAVLSPPTLDALESRGGYLVLYTHLFRRPTGMPITSVDWSPLADLARRHRAGRVQLTTTSRLLAYADLRSKLRWRADQSGSETTIHIDEPVAANDMAGITFYVPHGRPAAISLGGERLDAVRNETDGSGRESISIPWVPLRYPRDLTPSLS